MSPDAAVLERQLAEQAQDLALLRSELEETNRGVVALYAELEDNAVQLKDAADLKSRFLSYMSHEFRTPLASITSIAGILMAGMDGPLTNEQRTQIQFVQGSVRELTEMVDDLLDLAKVEAGRISISVEWFELVDLFSALRGMLRNFISNALKFTPAGEIRVTARALEGDRIEFAVTDPGIGIAPEHLSTLFSDFVQIDISTQKRLRGTGLGLSLARKFAELLGGEVGVQSQEGVGSRFFVIIPLKYGLAKAFSA